MVYSAYTPPSHGLYITCIIGSLIFKGTASGVFQIYHGKSHDFLWNNWIFQGKSCDFLWYIWIFHRKSHDSHWAKKIIEMIYLPERKIGRGESCESTLPVNYDECASRPYLYPIETYRHQWALWLPWYKSVIPSRVGMV